MRTYVMSKVLNKIFTARRYYMRCKENGQLVANKWIIGEVSNLNSPIRNSGLEFQLRWNKDTIAAGSVIMNGIGNDINDFLGLKEFHNLDSFDNFVKEYAAGVNKRLTGMQYEVYYTPSGNNFVIDLVDDNGRPLVGVVIVFDEIFKARYLMCDSESYLISSVVREWEWLLP